MSRSQQKQSMRKAKNLTLLGIQLSVNDNLLGFVVDFNDRALAWDRLRAEFASGHQSQLLMLTNRLHTLKIPKGSLMEDYINKGSDVWNKLLSMEEVVFY